MALNIQNLKVPTSEQAREYGSKGGKASVESKRRKKTMMAMLEMALTRENDRPDVGEKLKAMGFEETDNWDMAKIIASLIAKAKEGDIRAVEMIARLLYGDSKNVNVNVEGTVDTSQRVHIYLPERDEEPE